MYSRKYITTYFQSFYWQIIFKAFAPLCGDLRDTKMKILSYYRKDVRLPVQLQRAMAAEAEAAREARAKVNFSFDMISNFS